MPRIYSARYKGDAHNYYEAKTLYHIVISRTTENKFLVRTKDNQGIIIYENEIEVRNEWCEIKGFGTIER